MKALRTYLDIITEAMAREMSHLTMPLPDAPGVVVEYDNLHPKADDEETARIERRADGSYYGATGKYDFDAANAEEMRQKLMRFGYSKYVSTGRGYV